MTKDALNRLKELNRQMPMVREHVKRLESMAERTTSLMTGMPRQSSVQSALEMATVKLLTQKDAYASLEVEQLKLQLELAEAAAAADADQGLVLTMRYIDCRSFKEIAAALKCSVSHVFQLHRKGLKSIFKL